MKHPGAATGIFLGGGEINQHAKREKNFEFSPPQKKTYFAPPQQALFLEGGEN